MSRNQSILARGLFAHAHRILGTALVLITMSALFITTPASAAGPSSARRAVEPLTIITSALPTGTVGVQYRFALRARGGTQPYTWLVTRGRLPGGLRLTQSGVLVGTFILGTWSGRATFRVADAHHRTSSRSLVLTIANTRTAPAFGVRSIARASQCVGNGDCVVAGGINGQPAVQDLVNGNWSPAQTIALPGSGDMGSIYYVSCAALDSCVAVGQYNPTPATQAVFAASNSTGKWELVSLPAVGQGTEGVDSLACSSPGDCILGLSDFLPPGANTSFVQALYRGVWQPPVALLAASSSGGPVGTTCARTFCIAVSEVSNPSQNAGATAAVKAFSLATGAWGTATTTNTANLYLPKCFSNDTCLIAGSNPWGGGPAIYSYANGSVSLASDLGATPAGGLAIPTVFDCSSPTTCIVGGSSAVWVNQVETNHLWYAIEPDGSWFPIKAADYQGSSVGQFFTASCAGAVGQASCVVSGEVSVSSGMFGVFDLAISPQTSFLPTLNLTLLSSDKLLPPSATAAAMTSGQPLLAFTTWYNSTPETRIPALLPEVRMPTVPPGGRTTVTRPITR